MWAFTLYKVKHVSVSYRIRSLKTNYLINNCSPFLLQIFVLSVWCSLFHLQVVASVLLYSSVPVLRLSHRIDSIIYCPLLINSLRELRKKGGSMSWEAFCVHHSVCFEMLYSDLTHKYSKNVLEVMTHCYISAALWKQKSIEQNTVLVFFLFFFPFWYGLTQIVISNKVSSINWD